jgi:hypothetical protein
VMRGAGQGGGDQQLAAYLMAEMARLKDEIRDARAPAQQTSLIDQLDQLSKFSKTVATFATPPAATLAPEVQIALRRIDLEEQRIAKDREKELALRAAEAASENMRNDAIAKFIESFGPMLGQVAQKWLDDRSAPPKPAMTLSAPAAAAEGPAAPEIEGACPVCGVGLAMPEGPAEKCPGCGTMLLAAGGQITVANGNGAGPRGEPARVAS